MCVCGEGIKMRYKVGSFKLIKTASILLRNRAFYDAKHHFCKKNSKYRSYLIKDKDKNIREGEEFIIKIKEKYVFSFNSQRCE